MIECWFWEQGCKVDYPAWVQAIGSIIAIIAATGIAFWQNREASKERTTRHEERRKSQLLIVQKLSLSFLEILQGLPKEDVNDDEFFARCRAMEHWMNDLCESAKNVSFDTLSSEELDSFLTIQKRMNDFYRVLVNVSFYTVIRINSIIQSMLRINEKHFVRLNVIQPTSDLS